jgi:hypothetical protein
MNAPENSRCQLERQEEQPSAWCYPNISVSTKRTSRYAQDLQKKPAK